MLAIKSTTSGRVVQIDDHKVVGYKIRNKQGLYSSGGMVPHWNSRGKTWASTSGLGGHFAVLREAAGYKKLDPEKYILTVYADCVIVPLIAVKEMEEPIVTGTVKLRSKR